MSETGLQSGFYRQARSLAELVDEVLLSLNQDKEPMEFDAGQWERLGRILVQLGTDAADFQSKMLSGILSATPSQKGRWLKAGRALMAHNPKAEEIQILRELADRLEVGQANAVARMRGRLL